MRFLLPVNISYIFFLQKQRKSGAILQVHMHCQAEILFVITSAQENLLIEAWTCLVFAITLSKTLSRKIRQCAGGHQH